MRSERLEEEEVEGLKENVMPHHEDDGLRDLTDALNDYVDNVSEVLFADGDLTRMKIGGLESGKEEFSWSNVVAVGSQLHHRDLQFLKEALSPQGGVVAGTVPDEDRILSPVFVLGVQHLHQLHKVDLHDFVIGVGLKEADEDATEVVHAGDEGYPRLDADLRLALTP